MSYFKELEITDIYGQLAQATQAGELRTADPCRLAGNIFAGSVLDTNFWAATNTNGGAATVSGAMTLATNTTANGATQVVSVAVARYIGVAQCQYTSRIAMGDTGTANNTRRWGAFNGSNGVYFKLAGTTMYVATMSGGSETAIASASWNVNTTVPTLTNFNSYIILYSLGTVYFVINGVIVHKAAFPSVASWSATPHLPVWQDNVNSGGITTNLTMVVKSATIYRYGMRDTQDAFGHITTAGTYTLKYAPGTLHRITLNNPTGTLITIYDNTAGSGTVIGVINTPAQANPVTLTYEVEFNVGLTLVTTGTWDATVIYQ